MSLASERCGRCGAALVSMETDPDAMAPCPHCAEREDRARALRMTLVIAGTALVVLFSAWQMLTA